MQGDIVNTLSRIADMGAITAVNNVRLAGGPDARDEDGTPLFSPELTDDEFDDIVQSVGRPLTTMEEFVAMGAYTGVVWVHVA